jgi:hypothetical protein
VFGELFVLVGKFAVRPQQGKSEKGAPEPDLGIALHAPSTGRFRGAACGPGRPDGVSPCRVRFVRRRPP